MQQTKVLVFSAAFGNGHLRAAQAVMEAMRLKHPEVLIRHLDFGEFLNERLNRVLKKVYIKVVDRAPKLWEKFYYTTDRVELNPEGRNYLTKLGRSKFLSYIREFQPDCIVCTHPTVSSILAQLRLEGLLPVPVLTIVTDYAAHSHWVHRGVDRYIAACPEVKTELAAWGIEAERILETGIPVSPRFEENKSREDLLAELGLAPDVTVFLLMGGTFGSLRSAQRICQSLADSSLAVQIIVVCGKNEKLYLSLAGVAARSRNRMRRFKFVDNVDELMTVSDLIITKAGGLTVSEALTKHLPLVVYRPIPGQEEENARYIERLGAGCLAKDEEELGRLLAHFLQQPAEIARMRKKAALALPGRSAERAVEEILSLISSQSPPGLGPETGVGLILNDAVKGGEQGGLVSGKSRPKGQVVGGVIAAENTVSDI